MILSLPRCLLPSKVTGLILTWYAIFLTFLETEQINVVRTYDSDLNCRITGFTFAIVFSVFILFYVLTFQVSNLQYEMLLLTDSISKEGGCWELRLRCGKPEFFY